MSPSSTPELKLLSQKEMSDAKLPLPYRDRCAHLLVPLNKCRYDTWYLPWKCEDERHSYEKCQYIDFQKRVKKMDELKLARNAKSTPGAESGSGGATSVGAM